MLYFHFFCFLFFCLFVPFLLQYVLSFVNDRSSKGALLIVYVRPDMMNDIFDIFNFNQIYLCLITSPTKETSNR
jgi:hypothetical protein